ncbi:MAG TPA: GNAT family N-acetyltransferase [Steroidobacteraceae bacterium]|nr:GNAT family N-acetyltransferase [Steroidobacteraceae bacterium]
MPPDVLRPPRWQSTTGAFEMGDPTSRQFQIRPFTERRDYERMIDYFLTADASLLRGMGIDPNKLPLREVWLAAAMLDHERSNALKDRSYLAWDYKGTTVGHSSINKIKIGEEAFIHLHLWVGGLRKAGLGTQYFKASAAEFARGFRLQRLYCEPYAENPGPNRVLLKSGFQFIKRYRTVPGAITFEQDVNQYVLEPARLS